MKARGSRRLVPSRPTPSICRNGHLKRVLGLDTKVESVGKEFDDQSRRRNNNVIKFDEGAKSSAPKT